MANNDSEQVKMLWEKLMRYQTDLALPLELIFYYQSQDWLASRSVIDLGTGTGYYFSKLIECFPDKEYRGVDRESFYVKVARSKFSEEKYQNLNITIDARDLFAVKEKFDCVIARLVVQHLSSIEAFLQQASRILNPGGTLLIIDSHDPLRFFYPQLPYMESFFDTLSKAQKKYGGDRNAASIIKTEVSNFGFEPAKEMLLTIPSTIPGHKTLFLNSYETVFEIVRQDDDYQVEFDYPALKQEWKDWFSVPNSYTQLGVHIASYKKRRNEQ